MDSLLDTTITALAYSDNPFMTTMDSKSAGNIKPYHSYVIREYLSTDFNVRIFQNNMALNGREHLVVYLMKLNNRVFLCSIHYRFVVSQTVEISLGLIKDIDFNITTINTTAELSLVIGSATPVKFDGSGTVRDFLVGKPTKSARDSSRTPHDQSN